MSHCFCSVSISTVLQDECHQTVRGCPALHTVRLFTAAPAVPGSTPENIVLPNSGDIYEHVMEDPCHQM